MARHAALIDELAGARLAVPFDELGLRRAASGTGLRLLVWRPDVHPPRFAARQTVRSLAPNSAMNRSTTAFRS